MPETLPHDPQAERCVLGGILLDNGMVYDATTVLRPEDFFLGDHRKIYQAIYELADTNQPIDYITIGNQLRKQGANISQAILSSLPDGLPRKPAIANYVQIVLEKSRARKLLETFRTGTARIQEGAETDSVLADAQQALIDAIHHGTQSRGVTVMQAANEALQEANAIRGMESTFVGVPTGLQALDALTTGYRKQEFSVVGARPGNGKTAFMCQAVRSQVKAGYKPGIFSSEVPRVQIINRLACIENNGKHGISQFDFRDNRNLEPEQYTKLKDAITTVATWPLFLDDTPRIEVRRLCAIARMWVARGCDCIWVDYLQRLRAPGRNAFEQVSNIANDLWELGRSAGVPIVALSQLNRKSETEDVVPTMADLRMSGDIEQNANLVVLLHVPKDPNAQTEFIIEKQRSGEAHVKVPVRFNKRIGYFEETL